MAEKRVTRTGCISQPHPHHCLRPEYWCTSSIYPSWHRPEFRWLLQPQPWHLSGVFGDNRSKIHRYSYLLCLTCVVLVYERHMLRSNSSRRRKRCQARHQIRQLRWFDYTFQTQKSKRTPSRIS